MLSQCYSERPHSAERCAEDQSGLANWMRLDIDSQLASHSMRQGVDAAESAFGET